SVRIKPFKPLTRAPPENSPAREIRCECASGRLTKGGPAMQRLRSGAPQWLTQVDRFEGGAKSRRHRRRLGSLVGSALFPSARPPNILLRADSSRVWVSYG